MKINEQHRLIQDYNQRFGRYGYHPKTLGWGKERHRLRYHILLNHWKLSGQSLLDFGCGFGDMFGYCKSKNLDVKYSGIDINPTLIGEGKLHYPEANLTVADPLSSDIGTTFDIILASGLFNTKFEDNMCFARECFDFFAKTSTQGFAANFL